MLEAAERFDNPMALPVMDLTLEKDILLQTMGIPAEETAAFHFDDVPGPEQLAELARGLYVTTRHPRIKANCEALSLPRHAGTVVSVGMRSIGPFSLLTKLVKDRIVRFSWRAAASRRRTSRDVALIHAVLALAEAVVRGNGAAQIEAPARAIFLASRRRTGSIFRRGRSGRRDGLRRVRDRAQPAPEACARRRRRRSAFPRLRRSDSGDGHFLRELKPKLISFGSSVKLWEIEKYVDTDVVIFGNLPTRKFDPDEEVPLEVVEDLMAEIEEKLGATGTRPSNWQQRMHRNAPSMTGLRKDDHGEDQRHVPMPWSPTEVRVAAVARSHSAQPPSGWPRNGCPRAHERAAPRLEACFGGRRRSNRLKRPSTGSGRGRRPRHSGRYWDSGATDSFGICEAGIASSGRRLHTCVWRSSGIPICPRTESFWPSGPSSIWAW